MSKSIANYFGRVGKDISGASDIAGAIALAGLNFDVQTETVLDSRGNVILNAFNVARVDTGESLGVNGARYTPVQTSKAFSYLDDLAKQSPLTYHRGGMLKQGRFFVSVEFDKIDLKGDIISAFGVFLSSFDGTYANRFCSVFNREACMNICGYALKSQANGLGIAAKHTENCEVKLDSILTTIATEQARQIATFAKWQGEKFSSVEMLAFSEKLFPNKTTQAENARAKLVDLFNDARLGQFGQTRWDAWNAVTALETHESTRRNSSRASSDENAFDALVSHRSMANRAAQLLAA